MPPRPCAIATSSVSFVYGVINVACIVSYDDALPLALDKARLAEYAGGSADCNRDPSGLSIVLIRKMVVAVLLILPFCKRGRITYALPLHILWCNVGIHVTSLPALHIKHVNLAYIVAVRTPRALWLLNIYLHAYRLKHHFLPAFFLGTNS